MNHYSSSGDCVSQIENKDFITFKDYVCEVTGLTNYTLAYLSFYSMTNVGAACILYDVLRYVRRKTKDDKQFYRCLADKLQWWGNYPIPYPIYELTYLFKPECDKQAVKDFCEPLKRLADNFGYEYDILSDKCKLNFVVKDNKIQEIQMIYENKKSNDPAIVRRITKS